jgi:hypothetical protein
MVAQVQEEQLAEASTLGIDMLAVQMQQESEVVRKWAQWAVQDSNRDKEGYVEKCQDLEQQLRAAHEEFERAQEHCEELHELGEELQLASIAAVSVAWLRTDLLSSQHITRGCVQESEQVVKAVGGEVLALLATSRDRFDVVAVALEDADRVRIFIYFWPPTEESKDQDQSACLLAERLVRAVTDRAAPAGAAPPRRLLGAITAKHEPLPAPCRALARSPPRPRGSPPRPLLSSHGLCGGSWAPRRAMVGRHGLEQDSYGLMCR